MEKTAGRSPRQLRFKKLPHKPIHDGNAGLQVQ